MPVMKPGKRLLHKIPLQFVVTRVAGGAKKGVNADLNLTSMIDYLVITVVFLLSQFGAQQQVQSSETLELPTTPSGDPMPSAPIVSISSQVVLLDGNRIINTRDLAAIGDNRIDVLFERLQEAQRLYPSLHPERRFSGEVVFQIDRRVDWRTIKTVARTCALAGYTNLNFAVTKAGTSGPATPGQ